MSNLLKSRNVVFANPEKKVIDYNEIIMEKIAKIQDTIASAHRNSGDCEFVEGIDADSVERLLSEETKDEEYLNRVLEEKQKKADDIIALANEDAKAIVERAKTEADILREDSANAGRAEGYQEGRQQAEAEFNAMKQQLDEERAQLEIEYNERMNQLEPMLVETILKVFEKVTHVLAEDKKDLCLNLVNDVLSKTEISKEILIRVSGADYQFMLMNKDKITGAVSKKVQIEIIEDPVFKKGQCMIESDSGIYDCSLDIQLENLISTVRAMSCMVE